MYREIHGRNPNLLRPRLFTEKIQWRKLFDLNPVYAVLSDKISVRNFIASRVGGEWLVPLLWVGDTVEDIPFDTLVPPYILKCNHGSGFNLLVEDDGPLDRDKARATLRSYLGQNFGAAMREPGYMPIRPRLLAERLMFEPDGALPLERKVFVFSGRAQMILTIVMDRSRSRFDSVYDRDWRWLGWRMANERYDGTLAPPARQQDFITLAERIGAGFDHVRIDMYEWMGQPRVGELTFYSWSGLIRPDPPEADTIMGGWWELERPLCRALASRISIGSKHDA